MGKSASVVANDTPPSWSPSFTCFRALQLSQVYLHGAVEHCPGLGGLLALLLVEAPRRFLSFARLGEDFHGLAGCFALCSLWELSCAGFRHSAGFHARVILDGAACRLGEHGDVHDVLGVLGGDRVVPIVVRVLVSW